MSERDREVALEVMRELNLGWTDPSEAERLSAIIRASGDKRAVEALKEAEARIVAEECHVDKLLARDRFARNLRLGRMAGLAEARGVVAAYRRELEDARDA